MTIKFVYLMILLTACSAGAKKNEAVSETTENSVISYDTYCNERNGYCIDYPDFLIPQGESDNGDGQSFQTKDGRNYMIVFASYRMDEYGNNLTLKEAYMEDRQSIGSLKNELLEDRYILSREVEGQLMKKISLFAGEKLLTVVMQFDKENKELMDKVFEHISTSIIIGENQRESETEDDFLIVLSSFLYDCWWNQNFNYLLLDHNSKLRQYIYDEMDAQRVYSPGAIPILGNRSQSFGFDDYDDLTTLQPTPKDYTFIYTNNDVSICEIEDESKIYISKHAEMPKVVIDNETFEMASVTTPYPNAEVRSVILVPFKGSPWIFYFVNVPEWGWFFAVVDQTPCSA